MNYNKDKGYCHHDTWIGMTHIDKCRVLVLNNLRANLQNHFTRQTGDNFRSKQSVKKHAQDYYEQLVRKTNGKTLL